MNKEELIELKEKIEKKNIIIKRIDSLDSKKGIRKKGNIWNTSQLNTQNIININSIIPNNQTTISGIEDIIEYLVIELASNDILFDKLKLRLDTLYQVPSTKEDKSIPKLEMTFFPYVYNSEKKEEYKDKFISGKTKIPISFNYTHLMYEQYGGLKSIDYFDIMEELEKLGYTIYYKNNLYITVDLNKSNVKKLTLKNDEK